MGATPVDGLDVHGLISQGDGFGSVPGADHLAHRSEAPMAVAHAVAAPEGIGAGGLRCRNATRAAGTDRPAAEDGRGQCEDPSRRQGREVDEGSRSRWAGARGSRFRAARSSRATLRRWRAPTHQRAPRRRAASRARARDGGDQEHDRVVRGQRRDDEQHHAASDAHLLEGVRQREDAGAERGRAHRGDGAPQVVQRDRGGRRHRKRGGKGKAKASLFSASLEAGTRDSWVGHLRLAALSTDVSRFGIQSWYRFGMI